jgi:hypothetical protein
VAASSLPNHPELYADPFGGELAATLVDVFWRIVIDPHDDGVEDWLFENRDDEFFGCRRFVHDERRAPWPHVLPVIEGELWQPDRDWLDEDYLPHPSFPERTRIDVDGPTEPDRLRKWRGRDPNCKWFGWLSDTEYEFLVRVGRLFDALGNYCGPAGRAFALGTVEPKTADLAVNYISADWWSQRVLVDFERGVLFEETFDAASSLPFRPRFLEIRLHRLAYEPLLMVPAFARHLRRSGASAVADIAAYSSWRPKRAGGAVHGEAWLDELASLCNRLLAGDDAIWGRLSSGDEQRWQRVAPAELAGLAVDFENDLLLRAGETMLHTIRIVPAGFDPNESREPWGGSAPAGPMTAAAPERGRRAAKIVAAYNKLFSGKPRPPWPRVCDMIRAELLVGSGDHGYSDKSIQRTVRAARRMSK